ncbi:hypothetical protein FB107DRAFT_265516 [Schizophyllum commune]
MSSTSLDVSILPDDGLERNRRQLEHNLQQTDLSFHLSSDSEVEYPRHSSNHLDQFNSFENRSHFDAEPMHGWSYRTNDDEGIDPYGHGTLSTAAHHASVLTLSAGLGGRRQNGRREVSISGAEYDPDRPLHEMIGGVDAKLSAYDLDPSRSKYHPHGMSADPVDTTADLDRLLQSGHQQQQQDTQGQRSVRLRSPSVSSSSTSESDTSMTARPKLADALRRVSFSPRRPRSPQVSQRNLSVDMNQTPRPAARRQQPAMKAQPPTPSSAFTKAARGLARELQQDPDRSRVDRNRIGRAAEERIQRAKEDSSIRRPASAPVEQRRYATPLKGRIHLPDITGLTSAVESPGKGLLSHLEYFDDKRPREIEVRLLNTISTVQTKLQHLEEENMISRRRVRELELELEECKREVRQERTRMLEWESKMERDRLQQREEMLQREEEWQRRRKGKQREMDEEDMTQRYKEVVEEKKALESLITSLRTHLTRLTDELEQHKEMLAQIRIDNQTKENKWEERWQEVDKLREEVERLGGEVEVLRGVVEEGLKDRSRHSNASSRDESVQVSFTQDAQDLSRSQRRPTSRPERQRQRQPNDNASQQSRGDDLSMLPQQSIEVSNPDMGMSVDEDDEEEEEDETAPSQRPTVEDSDEEEDQLPFDPVSIPGSSRAQIGTNADRTIRTDRATKSAESSDRSMRANQSGIGETSRPFLDSDEIRQIEQEMEERRSSRSQTSVGQLSRLSEVTEESSGIAPGNISVVPVEQSRPAAPTPGRANRPMPAPILKPERSRAALSCSDVDDEELREAPFPQIRGARLERLFFSAPDHNQHTCTVCDRRRRSKGSKHDADRQHEHDDGHRHGDDDHRRATVDAEDSRSANADSDDEGFAEASEEEATSPAAGDDRVRQAFDWAKEGKNKGLPPQTVLARVIRELEDDFTHYKGVYVEFADQYKDMDAASDVRKRNILAQHLREVVDVLEQKGDQIASLYDLLNYKDKPVAESVVPPKESRRSAPTSSLGRSGASALRRTMA